jgi:hypothetical protein
MQNESKSNTSTFSGNFCTVPQNMLKTRTWNLKYLMKSLFNSNSSEPQKDLIDIKKYELFQNYASDTTQSTEQ